MNDNKEVIVVQGKELTFDVDKYKSPVLLSLKETYAQIVINALLMKPGNIPSRPKCGVNIMQYLYKAIDDIDSSKITDDLRYAIGSDLSDNVLSDVAVTSMETESGDVAVVSVKLRMPKGRSDDTLVVVLKKVDNRVHFNYKFMSDVVNLVS